MKLKDLDTPNFESAKESIKKTIKLRKWLHMIISSIFK